MWGVNPVEITIYEFRLGLFKRTNKEHGVRNSLLLAPKASTSQILVIMNVLNLIQVIFIHVEHCLVIL